MLQTKVVRDVESVEQMVQQTADSGLAAVTMLMGGLPVIAFRVPAALPAFLLIVPAAAVLVIRMRNRLRADNESFRQEVERRLSTIRTADRIVMMRDGWIAEVDTHDELSRRPGVYSGLQAAQLV